MEEQSHLDPERIIYLASRYLDGHISYAELQELEKWKKASPGNLQLFGQIADKQQSDAALRKMEGYHTEERLGRLLQHYQTQAEVQRSSFWKGNRYWISAAAIVLLVVGSLLFVDHRSKPVESAPQLTDVPAGGNRAILTLADGSKIDLDDTHSGAVAMQEGVSISKTADGQLVYEVTRTNDLSSQLYNTIETPNGGQYQVRLPDGTRVWLNAASTLRYPASFHAGKERRVELSGEAYFEVAHNAKQPFIVSTNKQDVKVLGTRFNVNSYQDENVITTTLEEGSVQVSANGSSKIITPGEQTLFDGEQLVAQKADLTTALAWKNGRIYFRDADIESIMRQVARWYDVAVVYKSAVPAGKFNGGVSRKANLSEIMKILELNDIHFILENQNGRKRLVLP